MAIRGIYSEAEQKMLDDFQKKSEKLTGWVKEGLSSGFAYPAHLTVTKELIDNMACVADSKNPLYRDEAYAKTTRWGGIIAPPFYYHAILHGGGLCLLEVPPEVGQLVNESVLMEHKSDFYMPIRPGDTFKIWNGPTVVEDVTKDGVDQMRQYKFTRITSYINQRDEVACSNTDIHFYTILPPDDDCGIKKSFVMETGKDHTNKKALEYTKDYVYEKDDIKKIDEMYNSEFRLGSGIRYWEDVELGEELPPIVMGPITTWDSVCSMQGFGAARFTMNDQRAANTHTVIVDPATNIPYQDIELHLTDRISKLVNSYSTTPLAPPIAHFLCRLVTNWAGDDGFIRRFSWHKLANTPFGDTIFGRGKVIRKYIENGEYMVDIDTRMETIRGFVTNACPITVCLLSRKKVFECNLAPIFKPFAPRGSELIIESDTGVLKENMVEVKPGDRIRVKERPDWLLGEYKVAGMTGTIVSDMEKINGYCLATLDENVTGIDVRVPLGFRTDQIEKID